MKESRPRLGNNLERYRDPSVVSFYAEHRHLEPAEELLFRKYLKVGTRILDLGVGGGRTTPFLSSIAAQYVGIDYSKEMIERCRVRFPDLSFGVADAAELDRIPDGSFDAIVFSFNGIDFIESDERRRKALAHFSRILDKEGHFIFSSHNADYLFSQSVRPNLHPFLGPIRWLKNAIVNKAHIWRTARLEVFWKGDGYILEPVDGGLRTHYATPELVRAEMAQFGFQVMETVPNGYPNPGGRFNIPWFHYACKKCR